MGTDTFFDSFRIVARQFLIAQRAADDLPPSYYDCPRYCPEQKKELTQCCTACPVQEQEKEFEQETESALTEALGDNWKEFQIRTLLNDVTDTFYLLEANPETLTATTARMIGIIKAEQARQRRIEDYNREQAYKSKNGK